MSLKTTKWSIKTEVPGMTQDDLDISHEDGVLVIKCEKKDEFEEKKKTNKITVNIEG